MTPRPLTRPRAAALVDRLSAATGQADRRKKVVAAAARLFSEGRYGEVRMEEIALVAGVGKGTLYTYFADKEELYFAVVFGGIHRLNELLEAVAARPREAPARLHEVMAAIVSFFRQNRFFFRLMSVEDAKGDGGRGTYRRRWHEERHKQIAVIEAILAAGVESGDFHILHVRTQAQVLRGMVRSVLTSGEDLTTEEMVETIMRTFLHGVERRGVQGSNDQQTDPLGAEDSLAPQA